MPDIKFFVNLLITILYQSLKNFDKTLYYFIKMIRHNLSPDKKIINYEKWLESIADKIVAKRNLKFTDVSGFPTKICILNTELYDNGGHTELALRYVKAFREDYPISIYITNSIQCPTEKFFNTKKMC
jgi:hypothetical protein